MSILPVNKAIGPDAMSHEMLKSTVHFCSKNHFNRSLSENIFPNSGKTAQVLPLFKKDDPCVVTNYRRKERRERERIIR